MIERIDGLPDSVIGMRAVGLFSVADYVDAIEPEVDRVEDAREELRRKSSPVVATPVRASFPIGIRSPHHHHPALNGHTPAVEPKPSGTPCAPSSEIHRCPLAPHRWRRRRVRNPPPLIT